MTHHSDGDELRDLLDSSFGDGPPPAPPAARLVPARRALRRRRLASGGATVAAVAAIATGVALLSGPGTTSRAVTPADQGPEQVVPAPTGPDWYLTWQDETDEPAPGSAEVTCGADAGVVVEVEPPAGGDGADLVQFADADSERLVAAGTAVVVEQTGEVDLPERFAPPGARTAVAQVADGDSRVYVLARHLPDSAPDYISHPGERFATIAEFLAFAEEKYTPNASGGSEGLR